MPDEPVPPEKEDYLRIWKKLCAYFFGWPEGPVLEWARRYEDGLNNVAPGFYNATPARYVAPLLVPERLRDKLRGFGLVVLQSRLQHAIEGGNDPFFDLDPDYDWSAARERVEAVLNAYGGSLTELGGKDAHADSGTQGA